MAIKKEEKYVNHEMVILARESRGLTQNDLAKKLSITQGALSRIEGGLRGMTDDSLKKLAQELGYPTNFFKQKRPIYGIGLVEVFHRKRQSVGMKTMSKVYSLIDIRTSELSRLLKDVVVGDFDIPQINLDDYDGSPKEIAKLVRAKWKLPHGPIQNLTSSIENARGIVIPFDFETTKIDAISHWPPGLIPLFFVNKFAQTDRMRFTLAHELGHIVMHQDHATPTVEQEANDFAAEFLMPEREIRPYLHNISIEKLATLKPYWKVSMAALLKRALDLRTITPRHGRTLWMHLSKAGYKVREPMEIDIPEETPALLKEIIQVHTVDMGYSSQELAKKLNLFEKELQDTYFDRESHIQLLIQEAEGIIKAKSGLLRKLWV
uniref:Putative peptidase n=1 Tax=viral metagenome TaxID=1070528 RepID=A0A6M3JR57_9ZZZZ